ncbi:MAG: response regulator [Eubacterium sp.]|nr:response regulator [Eubacterium sp.]
MKIMCVDDEPLTVEDTMAMCRTLSPDISVWGFTDEKKALEWIRSNAVDIALLDIDMPKVNGITLAARIKQILPDVRILFLTAYRKFAFDAFSVHPNGYLLKPIIPEVLKKEIDYAMSVTVRTRTGMPHIEACTFGNFDLMVDGEPIVFKRSKSKELLAYLVDRQGMRVTRAEIAAILFEDAIYDRSMQKYLDTIIRSLRATLREYNVGELLQMGRNGLRIDAEKLSCDMYRFYSGDMEAIKSFRGEYMSSYSWASFIEADMRIKCEK